MWSFQQTFVPGGDFNWNPLQVQHLEPQMDQTQMYDTYIGEKETHDVSSAPWPMASNSDSLQTPLDILKVLQTSLEENQHIKRDFDEKEMRITQLKDEVSLLRLKLGLSTEGKLPENALNDIVTKIVAAYSSKRTRRDWSKPRQVSILETLGILLLERGLNIPSLSAMQSKDMDNHIIESEKLKHQLSEVMADLQDKTSHISKVESAKLALETELKNGLGELELFKKEKEETQTSCRNHMKQHQAKSKDKDQELQKLRKVLSELRHTTGQQYKELKRSKDTIKTLEKDRDEMKKSIDDMRRHCDRYPKDMENKDNAIKVLQNNLKQISEMKNRVQQDHVSEKKKLNKILSEKGQLIKQQKDTSDKMQKDFNTQKEINLDLLAKFDKAIGEKAVSEKRVKELEDVLKNKTETLASVQARLGAINDEFNQKAATMATFEAEDERLRKKLAKAEAALQFVHEQFKHIMERLHKGGYAHWVKTWQQEWGRFVKGNARMIHLKKICEANTTPQKTSAQDQSKTEAPSSCDAGANQQGKRDVGKPPISGTPSKTATCVAPANCRGSTGSARLSSGGAQPVVTSPGTSTSPSPKKSTSRTGLRLAKRGTPEASPKKK